MSNKNEKHRNRISLSQAISAIGLLLYIFFYFYFQAKILGISAIELIRAHINLLYEFDNNLCILNKIGNMPAYSFSYYFIAFVLGITIVASLLGLIFKWENHVTILRRTLLISIIISFSLLISLQQIGRIKFATKQAAYTIGKTTQEKLLGRFDIIYDFPQKAKLILSKKQKVAFYTDLNSDVDSYASSKSLLKYFLYPDIILMENTTDITAYTLLLYLSKPKKHILDNNMNVLLNMNNEIILTRKNN